MPARGQVDAAKRDVPPSAVIEHHGVVYLEPSGIVDALTERPAARGRHVNIAGIVPLLIIAPPRVRVRHGRGQTCGRARVGLIRVQGRDRQSAFMETCQTIEHEFTAIDGQRTRAEPRIVLERQATCIEHNATTMTIRSR